MLRRPKQSKIEVVAPKEEEEEEEEERKELKANPEYKLGMSVCVVNLSGPVCPYTTPSPENQISRTI